MAHGGPPTGGVPVTPEIHPYHLGRVVYMSAVAALGGFLFGFDSAVVNGAVAAIQDKYTVSDGLIGFVVAIALLGSAVGAWFAGRLANTYGRRRVMVVAAAMFFVAAIGQAFPFALWDLMFWRFLGGAGIGIASVIAPMYIAEVAPAHLRGRLGSLQQLAIVTGIFASALSNFVILKLAVGSGNPVPKAEARTEWLLGLEAWQWMFLIMIIPAILYGLGAISLPESPRYLVSRGKYEEAAKVLSQIYLDDQGARVAEIRATVELDHKSSFRDLLGNRFGLLPIVWIGILLSMFQQFVGINVIFYYSDTIWSAVGFDDSKAFLITLITNTTNVVVTLIAIGLVDRIGRKPLLLIGSVGMALTLGVMAWVFGTAEICTEALINPSTAGCASAVDIGKPVLEGFRGIIAVVSANLYVVFFGLSWGPVVWVLLGEIFPNRLRAAALAVAAAAQWIANFVVTMTFPPLASLNLGVAYTLYTAMAILSFVFVLKAVKETKGKTLEELSVMNA